MAFQCLQGFSRVMSQNLLRFNRTPSQTSHSAAFLAFDGDSPGGALFRCLRTLRTVCKKNRNMHGSNPIVFAGVLLAMQAWA